MKTALPLVAALAVFCAWSAPGAFAESPVANPVERRLALPLDAVSHDARLTGAEELASCSPYAQYIGLAVSGERLVEEELTLNGAPLAVWESAPDAWPTGGSEELATSAVSNGVSLIGRIEEYSRASTPSVQLWDLGAELLRRTERVVMLR